MQITLSMQDSHLEYQEQMHYHHNLTNVTFKLQILIFIQKEYAPIVSFN